MPSSTLYNYLALCYLIVGRVDENGKSHVVEPDTAFRKFGLTEGISSKVYLHDKKGIYTGKVILVRNVKTGQIKEYLGTRKVSEDIGIAAKYISGYIKGRWAYKSTYQFALKEDSWF